MESSFVFVLRCSERTLDVLPSIASENPGKTRYESQLPLSSWNEQHQRTGRPVLDAYSSSYSEWNADKNWSSQEWKSDELMEVRTGRLVYEQPPGLFTEHTDRFIDENDDVDSDTVAESDMSLISRSFLLRVNDQVRKRQNQSSKDASLDSNKHSLIWGMFMSSTLEATVFMWKNFSENLHSIKNTGKDLTFKQMFDISEKLIVGQSDEIFGVNTMNLDDSSWKHFIFDWWWKKSSVSRTQKFTYFQILCYALGRWARTHYQILSGKTGWCGSKVHQNTEALDRIDGEPMEFEWNIFPGFTSLQLCCKVQKFLSKMSEEPEKFTGRIIFMSMFNDISWGSKDNEQESELSAHLVSICAERFSPGQWSFLGPGSEKKWYSTHYSKPQGE